MSVIEPDSQLYSKTPHDENELNSVEKNCILSASAGIQWQGHDCQFEDWSFFPNINLWRDYLPAEIDMKLAGASCGDLIQHQFDAGELMDNWSSSLHLDVPRDQFCPPEKGLILIIPAVGRFYPSDSFHKVPGIYQGNKFPCRITSMSDTHLTVDFNHPLAARNINMMVRIESIKKAGAERGGRCNDIPASLCDLGPGMQDRLADCATDFWSGNPFSRLDESDDSVFFQQARLTPYWDKVSLQVVSEFYRQHIAPQTHILDLMAGVHSPLQDSGVKTASVTSAGLNQQELDNNPVCTRAVVVDVNRMERLPFENEEFDVVLIHAAIEYVINPGLLFAEIDRILKSGGKIIISFSNRSEAQKTSQLWSEAHEFERPAIILSYLRAAGGFGHFRSYSKRGLFRPEDDELAHHLLYSDPVYIVQAVKTTPLHSDSRPFVNFMST